MNKPVQGTFRTPTGLEIVGTLETFRRAVAVTDGVVRNPDGTFRPAFIGTTDIDWDSQETVHMNGQPMWVDEDDGIWPEDQLTFVPES